jgi:LmbE family N-acetylglucosaminyl deacetylase
MKKSKILIIAAHPDDEIIGCGGAILKLKKKNKIKIIFTCKTYDKRINDKSVKKNNERQKIAKKVSKYLKINDPEFLNFNGLSIRREDITRMSKILYEKIIKFKPDTIFTHCIDDNHHDHRATTEATMIACRPNKNNTFLKKIYSFEIPSASEKLIKKNRAFNPNFFIDINETYKDKIFILKNFYKDELKPYPNFLSLKSIENLIKFRGNSINLKAAEAFEIVKLVE